MMKIKKLFYRQPVSELAFYQLLKLSLKKCCQQLISLLFSIQQNKLAEAGIKEVVFVTGRGKRAIEDHFDYSFELSKTLVEKNKLDLIAKVEVIEHLAKFSYVRQSTPLGDGHAINCAAHLVRDDEPVLIMFGDTLYDAEVFQLLN